MNRDYPYEGRPHRIYVALTNHCNRACPWCSMYSSPSGKTFITEESFRALLPESPFELQLEGGEPTTHPDFWKFVRIGRSNPFCSRIILCTNGARVRADKKSISELKNQLGSPLTLKLSINHYLLGRDPYLIEKASILASFFPLEDSLNTLVLNVRLRKGHSEDDRAIKELVGDAGLTPWSNIFYLQRYGLASAVEEWDEPFAVSGNFTLINPDGRAYGTDLKVRAEAMKELV